MSRLRWDRWRRARDQKPLAAVRVDHYLTREEMTDMLCASAWVETGTPLSYSAALEVVRTYLRSAPDMETLESWAENVTDAEAQERRRWAAEQTGRL